MSRLDKQCQTPGSRSSDQVDPATSFFNLKPHFSGIAVLLSVGTHCVKQSEQTKTICKKMNVH